MICRASYFDGSSAMSSPHATTIGILGAGRVGTALARQAMKAGYRVRIATTQSAADNALLVEIVTPGAVAVQASEAAASDLVVLAIPLHKYRTLNPLDLTGRIVIDAMNYWAPVDGVFDDFESDSRTTSEVVESFLTGARVVKSLNHIGYHELEEDDKPAGDASRRALALAGDDAAAKSFVSHFIDRLGYDAVDAGPLAAGRSFQPATEIFTGSHTANQLVALIQKDRPLADAA
ncbi:NADP oxidoreductase [Cryobacterium sp. TMT1-3]|uniref:NADP oxidoreductase n=2 Tax=Cryobacterium luteum TaxID=1424661 RepID=A0A5F0DF68_9MICO|nr:MULTISPECIES: NAD(P)-binding domain-containing protein [Cryobacterium]TFB95519.1 NADP oxidoreductase [Cryobacterium luteum]TFC31332.1 NADP oxidoreductase [Cryobacterium sp. TMT1-3]